MQASAGRDHGVEQSQALAVASARATLRAMLAATAPSIDDRSGFMVAAATALTNLPGVHYEPMGRGPLGFDGIGLVRACIQATVDRFDDIRTLGDITVTGSGAAARSAMATALRDWGMFPIAPRDARRGDVLLFRVMEILPAIVIRDDLHGGRGVPCAFYHAADAMAGARPGIRHIGSIARTLIDAFTWRTETLVRPYADDAPIRDEHLRVVAGPGPRADALRPESPSLAFA